MPRRAVLPLLLTALAGACALPAPRGWSVAPTAADIAADAALQTAAQQVRRCYRAPRVASEARQISTRLRVRLTADGLVSGLPEIVLQDGVTAVNQPYAGRMAQAAIAAVIRCAPLRLPESFFVEGLAEFDLTFSPVVRA